MINGLTESFDLSETEVSMFREHVKVVADILFSGGRTQRHSLSDLLRGKLIHSLLYIERHKTKLSQVYQREVDHILREARFRLQRESGS